MTTVMKATKATVINRKTCTRKSPGLRGFFYGLVLDGRELRKDSI